MKEYVYEINCDCTPFYAKMTDEQAHELRDALFPVSQFVIITKLHPLEIAHNLLVEKILEFVSEEPAGFAIKGFYTTTKLTELLEYWGWNQ